MTKRMSILTPVVLTVALSGCSLFKRGKEKEVERPATPLEQPTVPAGYDGDDQAQTIESTQGEVSIKAADPMQSPDSAATPTAPDGSWTLEGATGADKWGDLKPEYALCRDGKQQSPVDLVYKKPKIGRKIVTHYSASPARILDNGHTIQISFDPGNSIDLGKEKFELLYLQFKSSSEHTLSGNRMPMEIQLFHRSEKGEMAALSVILIEGPSHALIESIWRNIPIQKGMEKDLNFQLNPEDFLPKIRTYYHYTGSLTTPPCTEGVNWNVFNTPVTMSKEQIVSFRGLYKNNSRPVQNLNDRKTVNYK